jgi:hypothetical protein
MAALHRIKRLSALILGECTLAILIHVNIGGVAVHWPRAMLL